MSDESAPRIDPLGLVGTTIAEKYAVESVVGEGGFAIVYRATHLLWKLPIALKVFKALSEVPPEQREALLQDFIREGRLLTELSQRTAAICQARDIGMLTAKGESVPYMVLEWLEGASLEDVLLLERGDGMPPRSLDETVKLLDPAAEALAIAHTKGVAHRDVKPANLFVLGDPRSESATTKLLDFGIAKVVQDAQKMAGAFNKTSGAITSFTPAYGAPEQFNRSHGATGPWTDVFAFALVCVETVTGEPPLVGDTLMQLAFAAADPNRRPTPRTLGAHLPDEVEAVFAKALAVEPGSRQQTLGDFWNELRTALAMAPMRMTAHSVSHAETALAPAIAQAIASAPALPAAAPSPSPSLVQAAPQRSKTNRIAGIALLAVVFGSAGAYLATRGGSHEPSPIASASAPTASATPSSSAKASASASASAVVTSIAQCSPEMVYIPGKTFFMGEEDPKSTSFPLHKVELHPFCIDRFEVTTERYKACSDSGECKRAGEKNDWPGITEKDRAAFDPLCNIRDPEGHHDHPINCVDWSQARDFCAANKWTSPSGVTTAARLPTEAEWEFAARGPDGRHYPWGDEAPTGNLLNACGTECVAWGKKTGVEENAMYPMDDLFPNTAPVGKFPKGASRYGVEDVVGNVWEWVSDWYEDYPKDGASAIVDPRGPEHGTRRVIRGGAWNGSEPDWVKPTFRYHDLPSKRGYAFGFRCARSL